MFDKDNKFGFISNNESNNNGSNNNNIISMDEFKKILKEYDLLVYSYSITYKIMGLNPSNYTDILPKSIMSGKILEITITQNSITIDSITMGGLELNLSDVVTYNNQRTANINISNVIGDIVITGRANYPV